MMSYSQPTASVTVENPRISGSNFLFDVYFMRTNNDPSWTSFGFTALGNSSWFFNWNTTVLNTPTLAYVDTTLLPLLTYSNVIGNIGGQLAITTTVLGGGSAFVVTQDVWYHAFTVQCNITGAGQTSISWDALNTGLTAINASTSVTETYFDSGNDIATTHKCWTGAFNADWDNIINWSPNGVPTTTDDIIYPNNPTTELSVFISTYGSVQNLRVNHHAQLYIPGNKGLDVSGTTTLMGDTNIVLDCATGNGTLSSSFMPHGGITYNGFVLENGHIEVHRNLYYTETSASYYMHQVAAPVGGVILDDWDMIPDYSYAFEFSTISQDWWNIYVPSRPTPSGYGFIISVYDQTSASTQDVVFYDNLELGAVSPTFVLANNELALLGNPYTAPVEWDLMIVGQTNILNNVWVFDPSTGAYVSYVGGTGGNSSARYIQPGQSFFIAATGAATQFDMDPADRTHNIEDYLKDEFPNLLRVYTEGGNETSDEIYVRFKEGVTAAYDVNHDGEYWPSAYGEFATAMYTVSSDDVNLSIDARPMIEGEQVSIPLHFKPTIEAEYKLHADEESLSSFALGIEILLEDTFHPELDLFDMRSGSGYEFSATLEDDYDRFILHFYDEAFGIADGRTYKPIKIYSNRTDAFIMNDSEQLIKEILVYDIMGNLLLDKVGVYNDVTQLYVSDKTGYYVVKVITDKAVYTEKVFISK
ncbi:MAG: T9SS type A sorting domain-containing protein [Bacteroidetes bacterium]|nr:T9SS type A sorting domain-containing protein [Bacteroidota bacterium]